MKRTFYTGKYATAKFAVGVAIFFGVLAALAPVLTAYLLLTPREYIIQNAQGNFFVSRGVELPEAKEVLTNCIRTAVLALMNRTPDGVIDPVALRQSYMPQCGKSIQAHFDETRTQFETKEIRQVAEIDKIRAVNTEADQYRALVSGRLTRACQYMGESFVERYNFRIALLCAENPDMRKTGMLPLVVYNIEKLEITPQQKAEERNSQEVELK